MSEPDAIVFIVDHDASMRESLKNLTVRSGCGLSSSPQLREFLQSKRPDAPSCLVLDVPLPGA
jgi:FixJ family two-component response regulator